MPARRNSQDGLSMVEALVAMAILAIVSAPILSAFMVARAAQAEATGRTIAQSLARRVLEKAQADAYDNFDLLVENTTISDATSQPGYSVSRTIDFCVLEVNDGGTDLCVLKRVTAKVTWTGAKGRQLTHQTETLVERRTK